MRISHSLFVLPPASKRIPRSAVHGLGIDLRETERYLSIMLSDELGQPAPFPLALLADAYRDVRDLYATALDGMVGRFAYADDGREALVKALADPPSVLITDTHLPFIDGYELCTLLRRDVATRDMPIVMVTAATLPVDIQRAETAGADTVLVKPCLPETLREALQRLAARSSQLRERSRVLRARIPGQLAKSEALVGESVKRRTRHERGGIGLSPATPPASSAHHATASCNFSAARLGASTTLRPSSGTTSSAAQDAARSNTADERVGSNKFDDEQSLRLPDRFARTASGVVKRHCERLQTANGA